MPETQYLIHNTTRGVETRFERRTAPEPPRMTLMLGGGSVRVLRGRPQAVTESVVRRLLPELIPLERAGRLKVTTLSSLRVDITTFKVVEAPAVSPPLPHPLPDSADRDKNQNTGDVIPKHGDFGYIPLTADVPIPAAARGLAAGPVEDVETPAAEPELPVVPEDEPPPTPVEPPSTTFLAAPEEEETKVAVPEPRHGQGSKRDRRR